MRLPIAAVALLALAACPAVEGEVGPQGPEGPEGPPGYSPLQSGTRIKARVGTTADGAKLFLGWFDAERQENCSFRTAADGKVRCLPDVYAALAGRKFFSDEQCLSAVIPASDCMRLGTCAAPSLALFASEATQTPTGAIPFAGVFETSGLVKDGQVFELTEFGCGSARASPYLTIAREIPPSDFQGMEESLE